MEIQASIPLMTKPLKLMLFFGFFCCY